MKNIGMGYENGKDIYMRIITLFLEKYTIEPSFLWHFHLGHLPKFTRDTLFILFGKHHCATL